MASQDKTIQFAAQDFKSAETKAILSDVFSALEEKGYNGIEQIMGYLLSGDPAYVPRHRDARNLIRKINRDEIIKELLRFYLEGNLD